MRQSVPAPSPSLSPPPHPSPRSSSSTPPIPTLQTLHAGARRQKRDAKKHVQCVRWPGRGEGSRPYRRGESGAWGEAMALRGEGRECSLLWLGTGKRACDYGSTVDTTVFSINTHSASLLASLGLVCGQSESYFFSAFSFKQYILLRCMYIYLYIYISMYNCTYI